MSSIAQSKNEVDLGDLFANFFPNTQVQLDFAERSGEDYLVMCDQMLGVLHK